MVWNGNSAPNHVFHRGITKELRSRLAAPRFINFID